MPFTFAHPAAILPLRRSKFLHTIPLVVGSLTPDVPYFLPGEVARRFPDTHSLTGSFVICLPLGMAVLLLTLFLREPLTVLLGPRIRWLCQRSIDRFNERPLRWPIALVSILIGAWTHIAWDSFTHSSGWTTQRVEALSTPVVIFGWQTVVCHLLQYLSSVCGLVVLSIWLYRLLQRVPVRMDAQESSGRTRWILLTLIGAVAICMGVARGLWSLHAGLYYRMGFMFLTGSIGWFVALYALSGIVLVLGRPRMETAS